MKITDYLRKYIVAHGSTALQAKRRIYREWYSSIRTLDHDINEIDYLISIGAASMDDPEERIIMVIQRDIYLELLRSFGQPLDDPELKGGVFDV